MTQLNLNPLQTQTLAGVYGVNPAGSVLRLTTDDGLLIVRTEKDMVHRIGIPTLTALREYAPELLSGNHLILGEHCIPIGLFHNEYLYRIPNRRRFTMDLQHYLNQHVAVRSLLSELAREVRSEQVIPLAKPSTWGLKLVERQMISQMFATVERQTYLAYFHYRTNHHLPAMVTLYTRHQTPVSLRHATLAKHWQNYKLRNPKKGDFLSFRGEAYQPDRMWTELMSANLMSVSPHIYLTRQLEQYYQAKSENPQITPIRWDCLVRLNMQATKV